MKNKLITGILLLAMLLGIFSVSVNAADGDWYTNSSYSSRYQRMTVGATKTLHANKIFYRVKDFRWTVSDPTKIKILRQYDSSVEIEAFEKTDPGTVCEVSLSLEYYTSTALNAYSFWGETFEVTVNPKEPTSIELTRTSITMGVGNETSVDVNFLPMDAEITNGKWQAVDSSVISIKESSNYGCTIVAKSPGKTILDFSAHSMTAQCEIIVYDDDEIWMEALAGESFDPGKEICVPVYAVADKNIIGANISFRYSPDILTFERIEYGDMQSCTHKITEEVGSGKNLIKVKLQNSGAMQPYRRNRLLNLYFTVDAQASLKESTVELINSSYYTDGNIITDFAIAKSLEYTVTEQKATSVKIIGPSKITAPMQYKAALVPDNTYNQEVVWSISDDSIATIDEKGMLMPLQNGNVTITATSKGTPDISCNHNVTISNIKSTVNDIVCTNGVIRSGVLFESNEYIVIMNDPNATEAVIKSNHSGTLIYNGEMYLSDEEIHIPLTSDIMEVSFKFTKPNCVENTYKLIFKRLDPCAGGHTYSSDWNKTVIEHWRSCTQCGLRTEVAEHSLDVSGKCMCGFNSIIISPTHEHSFSSKLSLNESEHWYECECGAKSYTVAHSYNSEGRCICGAELSSVQNADKDSSSEDASPNVLAIVVIIASVIVVLLIAVVAVAILLGGGILLGVIIFKKKK